jgi:hypothetical protein
VDAAQGWAASVLASAGVSGTAPKADLTVLAALRNYQTAKTNAGQTDRASAAATLIKRHLPADLAAQRCSELTEQVLKDWLRARVESVRTDVACLSQGTRD